ncbi:MAG: hypothetical protein OXC29_22445, partial [Rhodococcus sp.]|nr:hypothetical protein [Rhodococcus sp. (in: high G+C Gram-positive bacteria)]
SNIRRVGNMKDTESQTADASAVSEPDQRPVEDLMQRCLRFETRERCSGAMEWLPVIEANVRPDRVAAFVLLTACESGGDWLAHGDRGLRETDGLGSHGLLQHNGGNVWGRGVLAAYGVAPGALTRDEVRPYLLDPVRQYRFGDRLADTAKGWGHWWHCAAKIGLQTPEAVAADGSDAMTESLPGIEPSTEAEQAALRRERLNARHQEQYGEIEVSDTLGELRGGDYTHVRDIPLSERQELGGSQ